MQLGVSHLCATTSDADMIGFNVKCAIKRWALKVISFSVTFPYPVLLSGPLKIQQPFLLTMYRILSPCNVNGAAL